MHPRAQELRSAHDHVHASQVNLITNQAVLRHARIAAVAAGCAHNRAVNWKHIVRRALNQYWQHNLDECHDAMHLKPVHELQTSTRSPLAHLGSQAFHEPLQMLSSTLAAHKQGFLFLRTSSELHW